ncbi:hypothetical protein PR202_ga24505 [Eleusine coracana subsp. coracana]|uniref:Uncharacterized protein n=1 Tax=Eleusine coracana subsp. coracana TaxID=191504 RepID=A0AAV5D6Z2_ELECO|nr:hypothetical protein PR202_ga24505 [Eleusine coracana subsp. coracana]
MSAREENIVMDVGSLMPCLPEDSPDKEPVMRGEKNSSQNTSLMVEIEKMFEHADASIEMARWKKHSIYRVPEWIKKMSNRNNAYQPRLVSLGPFHNGEPDLLPMEEHKRRALLHLLRRSGKNLLEFIAAINEVADMLLDAYSGLDEKWRGVKRGCFVEMMVVDGCFLLESMRTLQRIRDKEVEDNGDYATNDPIFSYHGFFFLWPDIRCDMLVLENQLPLLVLQTLEAVRCGKSPSAEQINNMVLGYLDCSVVQSIKDLGLHPLDIYHQNLCAPRSDVNDWFEGEKNMPSAVELNQAGISFKRSKTRKISDVNFENGVLTVPLVIVDSRREKRFLNLMAFERLHGDAGSDVTSYIFFMDNLVDTENDVALLRSEGVIKNLMSSNKEVSKLFGNLSKQAVLSRYSKVNNVHREVNTYCRKPWNAWRASFMQKYLRNPWVFISLVAAVILLLATLLQTAYTVLSYAKS